MNAADSTTRGRLIRVIVLRLEALTMNLHQFSTISDKFSDNGDPIPGLIDASCKFTV
jgi:hypothetical protein